MSLEQIIFLDHPVEAYYHYCFAVLVLPDNVRLLNLGFEDSRGQGFERQVIADSSLLIACCQLQPISYELAFHLTPGILDPLNPSDAILKRVIHTK